MLQTDVAVIGAGPGGLAAAAEAAAAGARVTLIDEYLQMGGQLFRQVPSHFKLEREDRLDENHARARQLFDLVSRDNVEVWLDTQVWGAFPELTLAARRGAESLRLKAGRVIVAAGAYDRPVPFPGWTLPGVMTAGAAQALAKSQWIVPGSRILLVGTGPFQLPVARQLIRAGAKIVAVVEAVGLSGLVGGSFGALGRPDRILEGLGYWLEIRRSGIPFLFGHTIVEAVGDETVEGAVIAAIDDGWRVKPGSERVLEVDTICTAFGFLPSTQITQLFGCAERFDVRAGGFLPVRDDNMETSVPGVFVAGETAGIGGSDAAIAEGRLAAVEAARQLGYMGQAEAEKRFAALRPAVRSARRFAAYLNRTFAPGPAIFQRIPDDTVVCRCEEVTAGEVRRAALEGADSLKAIKIATRAGMGLCQGRTCGAVVAQLASLASGRPVETFGSLSIRPPVKPIRLGDLARAQ